MSTPEKTTGGQFFGLWQAWKDLVPKDLARQNPLAVLALLEMCETSGGRFQMEIRSQAGLGESHLSKLLEKLVQVRWIRRSSSGGKHKVRITASGRDALRELRQRIGKTPVSARAARRGRGVVHLAKGQLSFNLDELPIQR